jgi:hypothetical protein
MLESSTTDFLVNAMPLLLHDHDCLVIPGLGGFLAHPVAAKFDPDKGEWIPPGRDVVFNPKLTVRDGLLEQEIRRATGCSTDAATQLIDLEVKALMNRAHSGSHTELPGLGRLFLQPDGQLGFAPEPRLGERYAAPGLGRIPWPVFERATPSKPVVAPETAPTENRETDVPGTTGTPLIQRALKFAAVFALPLLVAGSLLWNHQNTTGFSLLHLPGSTEASNFAPRIEGEDIRFPETKTVMELPFVQAGAPILEAQEPNEATMPIPQPQSIASGCSHHVIAGTFGQAPRAAQLARRFEALGYSASILPGPGGMQRVSAGCFNRQSDALQFQKALKARHGFSQAWVLHW